MTYKVNFNFNFNFILPKVNTDYIRQAQVLNNDNLREIILLMKSQITLIFFLGVISAFMNLNIDFGSSKDRKSYKQAQHS